MWWGLRIKNIVYYVGSLKSLIFRVGSWKKQYIGGICWKKGLEQFADLRGGLTEKRELVFLRGVDTQMHVMGN